MPFALLNHIGPPTKTAKETLKRFLASLATIVIVFGVAILLAAVLSQ